MYLILRRVPEQAENPLFIAYSGGKAVNNDNRRNPCIARVRKTGIKEGSFLPLVKFQGSEAIIR